MTVANLTWHHGEIDREARRRSYGHRGAVIWLTGLSGSGKSSIAHRLERFLVDRGVFSYVLDGDNVRIGLNRDLEFDAVGRKENIRRIGEVARLFVDAGALVITAFISPYRSDRAAVRALLGPGEFIESYVSTPLEICEARDPKQLYAQARKGKISHFTGVSDPYEAPEQPELVLEAGTKSVDACAHELLAYLETHGYLSGGSS